MKNRSTFLFINILVALVALFMISCSTYTSKVAEPKKLIRNGQFTEALEKLKILAETPGDDQLVYALDYATALQMAGQYKESSQYFLKSDQIAESKDYHSVSNVVGATLGGEEMIQYKGESFEKYLINTMAAINYLMMGQHDDALVEARRINEKISKMKLDGREPYELSPFAKYLSALIWESDQKYDDAYIDISGAYQLDPSIPFICGDLIRISKKARRMEDHAKWKQECNSQEEKNEWYDKSMGELVVIYQQGWGPEKRPRPDSPRFPHLVSVFSETQSTRLVLNGVEQLSPSQVVYNIQDMAIKTMNADYGALIARRVGGVVGKAIVSDQIRQKNELLGFVAWVAMNVSDRADLRQWSTLPRNIQMHRVWLKPGVYQIQLKGLDYSNSHTGEDSAEVKIEIKPGRKTFYNWRSLK